MTERTGGRRRREKKEKGGPEEKKGEGGEGWRKEERREEGEEGRREEKNRGGREGRKEEREGGKEGRGRRREEGGEEGRRRREKGTDSRGNAVERMGRWQRLAPLELENFSTWSPGSGHLQHPSSTLGWPHLRTTEAETGLSEQSRCFCCLCPHFGVHQDTLHRGASRGNALCARPRGGSGGTEPSPAAPTANQKKCPVSLRRRQLGVPKGGRLRH